MSEVLGAIEAGAFQPIVGWQCKDCVFRSRRAEGDSEDVLEKVFHRNAERFFSELGR